MSRYAGSYFAKALIPYTASHLRRLQQLGIEPCRVCLHCWFTQRQLYLEGETHVMLECPRYDSQRHDYLNEVSIELWTTLVTTDLQEDKLKAILGSLVPRDWTALARFLARVLQTRRKMRLDLVQKNAKLLTQSFEHQKKEWTKSGKHVCRHGVFFNSCTLASCPCLEPPEAADWSSAVLMPAVCPELKCIVTDTFNRADFVRLAQLRAKVRRQDW